MKPSDAVRFKDLITGVYAYHSKDITPEVIRVWWNGCQQWDLEQVTRAITQVTQDPEAGRFLPKIGDITRVLEGTHADRSMIAWGMTLEAMKWPGAYTDVAFDDPAIHAAVMDMGGWPKLCRTMTDDLGYVQTAFCKAHKAYTGRGNFEYPRVLGGERSPDADYKKKGLPAPKPVLIGDAQRCMQVIAGGGDNGKTPMHVLSSSAFQALMPPKHSDQEPHFITQGNAS